MWIAQCLDRDFATQGQSTRIALDALERLIVGQIALDIESQLEPLLDVPRAPKEYFDQFDKACQLEAKCSFQPPQDILQMPLLTPEADLRIYA
jgi:hypothetical protein